MKISPRDKKAYTAMLISTILSVVNTLVAFAVGAWTAPAIPLSAVFIITQFIIVISYIGEVWYWLGGP